PRSTRCIRPTLRAQLTPNPRHISLSSPSPHNTLKGKQMEIVWSLTPAGWAIAILGYTCGVILMYKLMVRTLQRKRNEA
ncbi:MAG: hypothetical protein KJN60_11665, partial [Boseongicola sp.]|nr:hypothetical protein [Boseongicola sp.]